jgi:hypothetical protein
MPSSAGLPNLDTRFYRLGDVISPTTNTYSTYQLTPYGLATLAKTLASLAALPSLLYT